MSQLCQRGQKTTSRVASLLPSLPGFQRLLSGLSSTLPCEACVRPPIVLLMIRLVSFCVGCDLVSGVETDSVIRCKVSPCG